jgi:hypothetical protein
MSGLDRPKFPLILASVSGRVRGSVMPVYRFYSIKKDDHVAGPPVVIEAPTDSEAIAKARQQLDGLDIEIWDGGRKVAYLASDEK